MAKDESGHDIGWEEYYDYHFPDDEKKVVGLKLLENAMKWKKAMTGDGDDVAADASNDNSSSHDLPPGFFDSDNNASTSTVLGKRDNAEIDLDDDV